MENSINHTYHIGGMGCNGCASTVKQKLSTVPEVISVQVDLGKKQAQITSSKLIKLDSLQDALHNTHYSIAELRT
ncbi:MAG: heavy metal-associated domain-containing protein [Saprospiraceae bacterium]